MKDLSNLFAFALALFSTTLFSQEYTITGKVVNQETQEPIEFVNVLLFQTDSIQPQGTITNASGDFSIKVEAGNYTLRLTQFGQELLSQEISIFKDTDLGILSVNESIILQDVIVEGGNVVIKQKADRLIFTIENSFLGRGRNMMEVLEITPLVNTYGDNINIMGKSSAGVVVDGKGISLRGNALTNYLRSVQSDSVKSIEIITSPTARGGASGNSGTINIVFKKNPAEGWSGSSTLTYKQRNQGSISTGTRLNYANKKLSASTNIYLYRFDYNPYNNSISNTKNQTIINDISKKINDKGLIYYLYLDYKISDNSKLGFAINGKQGAINSDENSHHRQIENQILTQENQTNNEKENNSGSISVRVSFNHSFEKAGNISLLSAYSQNKSDTPTTFHLEDNTFKTYPNEHFSTLVNQIGYTFPWKWARLDTGIRYAIIENDSDFKYFKGKDNLLEDFNKSNHFIYRENNTSTYLASQKEVGNWTFQLGIRYEHTYVTGDNKTIDKVNTYSYGDFFPSANISYDFEDNKSLALHYNRRISRPNIRQLNPHRRYDNNKSYSVGNPFLEPAFAQNIELNYLHKKYTLSLYYQKQKDINSLVSNIDNNGNTIKTYDKGFNQYDLGIYGDYRFSLLYFWNSVISANAWYSNSKSIHPTLESQKGYSGYFFMSNAFSLNPKKTYQIQINFRQFFFSKEKNIITRPYSDLNARFSASFLNKKLHTYIEVTDILKGNTINSKYLQTNLNRQIQSYDDNRAFIVGLSYRFGNRNIKGIEKEEGVEEENRK